MYGNQLPEADQRQVDPWPGKEVERVTGQRYVNFGGIYKIQMKGIYATATRPAPSQRHNMDISLEEWVRIFMAFQAEHVMAFLKDALSSHGYVDLIIKMKAGGMFWL